MTYGMYSIHDKLAGSFSDPVVLDERITLRTFNYLVKERREIDCADREIVKVGEWNNETGEVTDMYSHYGMTYDVVFDMEKAKKDQMEREHK